jgi:bifunctional non-homologous end joining protein LigD
MAFDLPWCAGRSYVDVPLEERKEILRLVLREHHVCVTAVTWPTAWHSSRAAAQGLEGAMAKHRLSRYEAGRRSAAWLKLKVRPTQELVVGGYVRGHGSHRDLGALVVGVMEEGRLRYAGRVGSGLDAATRSRLRAALDVRSRPDHPFDDAPRDLAATADATWAAPDLVIRAEIGGWSRDGIVRQATFAQEAPEVDPVSVERQVAVGPEAAARAMAKAGVGPVRHAAATHPVNKPNGSRLSKDEAGRDAKPPVAPPTEDVLAASTRARAGGRGGSEAATWP